VLETTRSRSRTEHSEIL